MGSRKKRKLDAGAPTLECFEEIVAELDHELCLRRRLAQTVESRITWALVLQEELRRCSSGSRTPFKDTAFEAISSIETPLDVLFTRDTAGILGSNPLQPARLSRPPRKQKVTRNANANFLYIRSSDLQLPYDKNHVQTYLLKCPRCLRTTFTSLQGLLNHARISHGLEWGTHDECVRACAVVDLDIDIETGIEVGLGPNGILPGLRSLFQMAVTAQHPQHQKAEANIEVDKAGKDEAPPAGSHLVRTLGLHEDTPALAPFLGKQAVRRGIKVLGNGDEFVDIDGFCDDEIQMDGGTPHAKNLRNSHRTWRMQFTHRNDFDPETASNIQEVGPVANTEPFTNQPTSQPSTTVTPLPPNIMQEQNMLPAAEVGKFETMGSRFHFAARVIVMDRSFWIPPDRRAARNKGHTHKWMVSIDSPSYSYHITTILKRLTVSSPSTLTSSCLTATSPPFVVVGTTDVPFLAKVELCFSGAPGLDGTVTDQLVHLEHWVELDLLKSATPVVGDEQVVDIELDKGTILLPIQKGYTPIGAKGLWSQTAENLSAKVRTNEVEPTQVCEEILSSIVGRFPMTIKDSKSVRHTHSQVPYKLVLASQFKSFVPGRRKAIEWSRARAIRDAYTVSTREPRFAARNPVPLTTADVYTWLLKDGHFIRSPDPSDTKKEDNDQPKRDNYVDTWCPTCGQGFQAHVAVPAIQAELTPYPSSTVKMEAGVKSENGKPRSEATRVFPIPCNVTPGTPKIPMVNAYTRVWPFSSTRNRDPVGRIGTLQNLRIRNLRGADLVAASDPNLTVAVRNVIRSLKLPSFGSSSQNSQALYPLDELGMDRTQIENHLAPYAILATVVQRFMGTLIEGGLSVARREKATSIDSTQQVTDKMRRDGKEHQIPGSLLTPAHILNSVISPAQGSISQSNVLDVALLECLTRLGVPATPKEPSTVLGAHGQADEPIASVKEEL